MKREPINSKKMPVPSKPESKRITYDGLQRQKGGSDASHNLPAQNPTIVKGPNKSGNC